MCKIDDKRLVCGVFARWLFRFFVSGYTNMHRTAIMIFVSSVKTHLKKSCLHSVLRAFAQKRANFLQPFKLFAYFPFVALPLQFFYMQRCFFKLQPLQIFKTAKKDETLPFVPCAYVHNIRNVFCLKRKNALEKELFTQCFKGICTKTCKLFETVQTFCLLFLCCFAQLSFFLHATLFFQITSVANF